MAKKEKVENEKIKRKKIYSTWYDMVQRCFNLKSKLYYWYGERGITVCERWLENTPVKTGGRPTKQGCLNFYNDMESTWTSEKNSIDRIDNDGNYEPLNCQWLSRSENSKKENKEKIENGTHHFQTRLDGTSIASDKVKNGTHHLLRRSDGTSLAQDRVANGTHNLLSGEIQRKSNKERISNGTHNFQGKGKIWINNGIRETKILLEDLQNFIEEGWKKGRNLNSKGDKYLENY